MKLTLRHKDFCDGCEQLKDIGTIGGHKRCKIYDKVMLPQDDTFLHSKGLGYFKRPENCITENETEVSKNFEYRKKEKANERPQEKEVPAQKQ